MPLSNHLSCRIQHILNKNSVSLGRIIDKYMRYGSNYFPVLNDRAAAHE